MPRTPNREVASDRPRAGRIRHPALMGEHDLAPLAGGADDRVADLERRHAPAAVVDDGLALGERRVQPLPLGPPGPGAAGTRAPAAPLAAITEDPPGRLADVAALEARPREADPADMGARSGRRPGLAAAGRVFGAEAHAFLGLR